MPRQAWSTILFTLPVQLGWQVRAQLLLVDIGSQNLVGFFFPLSLREQTQGPALARCDLPLS
jgi:hypothetical protein